MAESRKSAHRLLATNVGPVEHPETHELHMFEEGTELPAWATELLASNPYLYGDPNETEPDPIPGDSQAFYTPDPFETAE